MEKQARPQSTDCQNWLCIIMNVVVCIITVPYRRSFKLYTWRPLRDLRAAGNDRSVVLPLVRDFQTNKYAELQSVQVAGTFCAGATLAVLPWTKNSNAIWMIDALWCFSLWALITSIQTKSMLDDLPQKAQLVPTISEGEMQRTLRTILRYRKRPHASHWVMVFLWQFPSMCMSYAWTTFIAGLTVYLCNPLIRHEPWGNGHKIAILYLCVGGFGSLAYMVCSIFVYVGEKDVERSEASSRVNTNTSAEEDDDDDADDDDDDVESGPNPAPIARARALMDEGNASRKRQLLV